uniref:Uncharacterized protein n=1 Tax=Setaria viridis TaxID=4556 RepID=A0A4U6VLT4_SETVI|nr:hypothetical protein SEVIR_3G419550v2 [Setaria viridis]
MIINQVLHAIVLYILQLLHTNIYHHVMDHVCVHINIRDQGIKHDDLAALTMISRDLLQSYIGLFFFSLRKHLGDEHTIFVPSSGDPAVWSLPDKKYSNDTKGTVPNWRDMN